MVYILVYIYHAKQDKLFIKLILAFTVLYCDAKVMNLLIRLIQLHNIDNKKTANEFLQMLLVLFLTRYKSYKTSVLF